MATKYTPGEWTIVEDTDAFGDMRVQSIRAKCFGKSDLVAACKAVDQLDLSDTTELRFVMRLVRAAIAKAQGGAK
jgi:hypothetical protein